MARPIQLVKAIVGPLKRRLFRLLVSRAYRKADRPAHRWMQAIGRRRSERRHSGRQPLWMFEWIRDCTLDAQTDFFRRHRSDPLDLGTAPIGFKRLRIRCATDNANSSSVYLFGRDDGQMHFEVYRRFARPGTCAVDVGANLGIHTLVLAACVGAGGKVHAFEPLPSIATRLEENLKLNGVAHVDLHREALGSRRGQVVFDSNPSDFNIGKGRVTPHGDITVPIGTLDARLGSETLPVSVIKIDTEGHELEVVKGAAGLLARHRPAVLMEFNPEAYGPADLRQHLPDRYTAFRLTNRFGYEAASLDSELHTGCELLVVPNEMLKNPLTACMS